MASHSGMGELVEETGAGRGGEADSEADDESAANEHSFSLGRALERCAGDAEERAESDGRPPAVSVCHGRCEEGANESTDKDDGCDEANVA